MDRTRRIRMRAAVRAAVSEFAGSQLTPKYQRRGVSQWLSAETQRLSCFTNPPDSPAVTSRIWPLIGLIVKSHWLQSAQAAGMNEAYAAPQCLLTCL